MKEIEEGLINQAESCIETLEAYISGEECRIITPSIIIDDLHDQCLTERVGKVFYYELEETDKAFTNYCNGIEALGYDTLELRTKYADLRNKCEKIFEERKT